jgi:hAT family C-terminal dimerisation region
LSVITRWGTQYFLVQSLLDNKDAIKRYADEFGLLPASERIKQPALNAIRNREFWGKLEALRELLKPIDECLRMSESGKSHLGHVLNRWKVILKHLKNRSLEHEELKSFIEEGAFMERYNRQVLAIHITAFYLMPATTINDIRNESIALPLGFETQITEFVKRYSPSAEAARAAIREFMLFRSQQPPFEPVRQCWQELDDPHLFWCIGIGLAKNIGTIALRLYSAPVNSVASERAFSVQNFIHNKTRNRLQPVRADKLSFVYSNARILDRDDVPMMPAVPDDLASKPMGDLTSDEQVLVEGYLLELEAEDEIDGSEEIELDDDSDEESSVDGKEMEEEW